MVLVLQLVLSLIIRCNLHIFQFSSIHPNFMERLGREKFVSIFVHRIGNLFFWQYCFYIQVTNAVENFFL